MQDTWENFYHKPGGGDVKISHTPTKWDSGPKVDSFKNYHYKPKKTPRDMEVNDTNWNSSPRVGSLDNVNYTPGGGNVSIVDEHLHWDATAKVGSLDNDWYVPSGGHVAISSKLPSWKKQSKVGSFDNIEHESPGGQKRIFSERVKWKAESKIDFHDNEDHVPGGGKVKIPRRSVKWNSKAKVGSFDRLRYLPDIRTTLKRLEEKDREHEYDWDRVRRVNKALCPRHDVIDEEDNPYEEIVAPGPAHVETWANMDHVPGGGYVLITDEPPKWYKKSKIGSLDNAKHVPGGGSVQLETRDVKWEAKAKVGSFDNINHQPRGGKVKVSTEKLKWNGDPKLGSLDKMRLFQALKSGDIEISEFVRQSENSEPPSKFEKRLKKHAKRRQEALDGGKWYSEPDLYEPGDNGGLSVTGTTAQWHHKILPRVPYDRLNYEPGGGNVKIKDERLIWKSDPRVRSLENVGHVPGGGKSKIFHETLEWRAEPKVDSYDVEYMLYGDRRVSHSRSHQPSFMSNKRRPHRVEPLSRDSPRTSVTVSPSYYSQYRNSRMGDSYPMTPGQTPRSNKQTPSMKVRLPSSEYAYP